MSFFFGKVQFALGHPPNCSAQFSICAGRTPNKHRQTIQKTGATLTALKWLWDASCASMMSAERSQHLDDHYVLSSYTATVSSLDLPQQRPIQHHSLRRTGPRGLCVTSWSRSHPPHALDEWQVAEWMDRGCTQEHAKSLPWKESWTTAHTRGILSRFIRHTYPKHAQGR